MTVDHAIEDVLEVGIGLAVTVSGRTIVMVLLSDGNSRHSQTNSSRSAAVSLGLEEACRCHSIVISASNCDCVRKGAASTWTNSLRKSSIAPYASPSLRRIQPARGFR
jgi:Mg-chelatase subunit ChlD